MSTLDRIQTTSIEAPIRGMVTSVSERNLPEGAARSIVNYDVDTVAGRLVRRDAWASMAGPDADDNIPLHVFEFPVSEPAGAPSIPRVLVTQYLGQTVAVWMRPSWHGVWINQFKLVGTALILNPTTLFRVYVREIVMEGEARITVGYARTTDEAPNANLLGTIWLGFIPASRKRFSGEFPEGLNRFRAIDARILEPRDEIETTLRIMPRNPGQGASAGTRYYRTSYLYDGYQHGALSEPASISIASESQAVRVRVKALGPTPFVPEPLGAVTPNARATQILVWAQPEIHRSSGVGGYSLLRRIELDRGLDFTDERGNEIVSSSVKDDFPFLESNVLSAANAALYDLDAEARRAGLAVDQIGNPWNDHYRYLLHQGGYTIPITKHFPVLDVADKYSHFRLSQLTEHITAQPNVAFRVGIGETRINASPRDGGNGNGDGEFPGVGPRLFHGTLNPSYIQIAVSAADSPTVVVRKGDFILAWDWPTGSPPVATNHAGEKPFQLVQSVTVDEFGQVIIRLADFLPASGVYGGYWMSLAPVPAVELSPGASGTIVSRSFVETAGALTIFGDVAGTRPTGKLEIVDQNGVAFVEEELRCADSRTMVFNATQDYQTRTNVNHGTVKYASGWQKDPNLPLNYHVEFDDANKDSALSSDFYQDFAQHNSTVPYSRGSAGVRIGRRMFLGDVAIPDPVERDDQTFDTIRHHRILYSSFTGEGNAAPDSFPPVNEFSAGEGSSAVIALLEYYGRLLILTSDAAILALVGAGNAASVDVERVWPGRGAVGSRAVVSAPVPIWLGPNGVNRLAGGEIDDTVSDAIRDAAFLQLIVDHGQDALLAWDSKRSRLMLHFPTAGVAVRTWVMARNGAWVRYELGFTLDAISGGRGGGFIGVSSTSDILVVEDSALDFDLDSPNGIVNARCVFPTLQPAGGDRLMRVVASSVEFIQDLVAVLDVDDAGVGFDVVGDSLLRRTRVPVQRRGRSMGLTIFQAGRGAAFERAAVEWIPKARLRSIGAFDLAGSAGV